jgi:hypothetical protein
MYWYNNTFYNCSHGGNPISGGYSGADNMTVKNNIFVGCGQSIYGGWYNYQSGTGDYNFVAELNNGTKSGFSEQHGINGGNAQFVAAYTNCVTNACDFHIKSTSAVKDKGAAIAGFSVDKDGVVRPQDSGWDMGAYEFVNTQVRSSNFEVQTLTPARPLWPNPMTIVYLSNLLAKDLKIYNLSGHVVNNETIHKSGIYLLQENGNSNFHKVTILK